MLIFTLQVKAAAGSFLLAGEILPRQESTPTECQGRRPQSGHHAEREGDMRFAQEIKAESIEEVGDLDGVRIIFHPPRNS